MKKLIILIALILSSCSSMSDSTYATIGSPTGVGRGVTVSPNGLIVTAAHVVADSSVIYVNVNDSIYEAKLVYRDVDKDLALIKVEAENLPYSKVNTEYKAGDKIKVAFYGGKIMSVGGNSMVLNAKIVEGDSGGPVFNSNKELVGIVTGFVAIAPNIGLALPAREFTKVINLINK